MKRALFIFFAIISVAISGCKKETYTVTFNANGGTGTMQEQTFTEGKAQPLAINEFTYRGYIFEGWNTASNGGGVAYDDHETITVTHDMTLYAQWKKVIKHVTVTFDANGGSGEMEPQQFIEDVPRVLVANAFTNGNHPFNCWNTMADGSGTTYTDMQLITISKSITLYAQWSTYEFVDLGLPSGTLWANCNVGASVPEEYGNYYAWEETHPKSRYLWYDYKYCCDGNNYMYSLTKYCNIAHCGCNGYTDTLVSLLPEYDVAIANWGASWRMPTWAEMTELLASCSSEWTVLNGVNGLLFTGPNGNMVFFPAAGGYEDVAEGWPHNAGTIGNYWSSSLVTSNPLHSYILAFQLDLINELHIQVGWSDRSDGLPVRPVVAR